MVSTYQWDWTYMHSLHIMLQFDEYIDIHNEENAGLVEWSNWSLPRRRCGFDPRYPPYPSHGKWIVHALNVSFPHFWLNYQSDNERVIISQMREKSFPVRTKILLMFWSGGDRIRTRDLKVMSLASYQTTLLRTIYWYHKQNGYTKQ